MERDPQETFDVFFDVADLGYDPLVDLGVEDDEFDEMGTQLGPPAKYQANAGADSTPDERPASQRIADLFAAWAPRRRVLLEILRFLDVPRRADALQQKVDELQTYDLSVYSGYNFSMLLSEAGAIDKANEDGSVFDEQAEQLPDIVEVDGMKFFKPTDGKQVYWVITDEGRAWLEADDPFARLVELIADEPQYRIMYKAVLEFCDSEAGRSADELVKLVDNDPLVQKPRKYFSYFVKKLEDCGALLWTKKWQTTELGKKGLECLFSEDVFEDVSEDGPAQLEEKRDPSSKGEQL
jgi:hypothetical protein